MLVDGALDILGHVSGFLFCGHREESKKPKLLTVWFITRHNLGKCTEDILHLLSRLSIGLHKICSYFVSCVRIETIWINFTQKCRFFMWILGIECRLIKIGLEIFVYLKHVLTNNLNISWVVYHIWQTFSGMWMH